ncbi:MAG: dihydroneopterin aldolase [Proteobacteria bacterium]|nr:dihydroneopterin aldolase [Pseudomonadota bacterium]
MNRSDTISIQGLEVECVVGVYPRERSAPQRVVVDVDCHLDLEPSALRERLRFSIDYRCISEEIVFLLRYCGFRMLETAAYTLARYLLAPPSLGERRSAISEVWIRLTKPGALPGGAAPSLSLRRRAAEVRLRQEQRPFGVVDVVHETKGAGVYRLNVAPGAEIPLHLHRRMREVEMVLTHGLVCQSRAAPPRAVHRWPLGAPHGYKNPTDRYQTILCVDAPRFIEEDEIPVPQQRSDMREIKPEYVWIE